MKRFLTAALAASLILTLFSCGGKNTAEPADGTVNTEETAPAIPERVSGEIRKNTIRFSGFDSIAIVKPADASGEVITASSKIYTAVKNATGTDPVFCTDQKKNGEGVLEILIGKTSRDASLDVTDKLRIDDYYIGVNGSSVIVAGGSDASTVKAIEIFALSFASLYEKDEYGPDDFAEFRYTYRISGADIAGVPLDRFSIIYPAGDEDGEYKAQKLRGHIFEEYQYDLVTAEDTAERTSDYEILVGTVSRSETEYLRSEPLPEYCFDIAVKGTKLVFATGSLWAFDTALGTLDSFVKDGVFSVPADTDISVSDASVKKTEHDFVYIRTKGRDGDIPVKKLTLCGADISEYSIVYHDYGESGKGACESEMFAANELRTYIEYATGTVLPLVKDTEPASEREIVVGTTSREKEGAVSVDRTGFGDEGLYIASDGTRLVLAGGEKRGTLYAVYTFLEDYIGCRFFSSDCEIIYCADRIDVPSGISVFEKSDLEYRDNSTFSVLSSRTAPKLKMNSSFRRSLDDAHGGSIKFLNDNEGFVHTMSRYLGLGSDKTQPCLTDEENYEKAIAAIRLYMGIHPDADIVSISQNDNNNYCRCSECARVNREEGSQAGTLIRFVNRIANELGDEFPNVKFMTLAYMYSEEPPKTAPAENVIVELCNFEDCLAHTIGECSESEDFFELLRGWDAITDDLYVWFYGCSFWPGNLMTPFMNFDALYDDFRIFRENGVKGVFIEGITETFGNEFGELRAYLLAKLMWDPDMTKEEYEEAIHEFIAAYYGPVSGMVQNYFDFLRSASGNAHYNLWAGPSDVFDNSLMPLYLNEISKWWATATVIECENPDTGRHIKMLHDGFRYVSGCFPKR